MSRWTPVWRTGRRKRLAVVLIVVAAVSAVIYLWQLVAGAPSGVSGFIMFVSTWSFALLQQRWIATDRRRQQGLHGAWSAQQ